MRQIMVASDLSERSDRAVRRAALLARRTGATLSLIHVVDDDAPRRKIEIESEVAWEILREQAAAIRDSDGVPCEPDVVVGDPFVGIAQAVRARHPDMLVLGPYRRRLLRDVFIGTTAQRVIREARCAVLMTNGPTSEPYRHALLTTDLSPGSRRALDVFVALGIAGEAPRSLLHVFDTPALQLTMSDMGLSDDKVNYIEAERARAGRGLSDLVAGSPIGSAKRILRRQKVSAARDILDTAEEIAADLVVVGAHGRSGVAQLFMGGTAEEVLRRAVCDVLAVPSEAES